MRRWSRGPPSPSGPDGKLTVWTGTQRPFGVRGELARALGIPRDRVRVIVPDMGSGYGGKHTGEAAVEAARLAKAAGKPVKLVWTREEEFTWAYFRPAGVIEVTAGARKDGTLTAWECPQLQLRRLGAADALRRGQLSTSSFTAPTRRCGRVPTAPWRRRRTLSRANRTWTTWPMRLHLIRWPFA